MLSATTGFVAIAGGVGLAYEVPALVSAAGPAAAGPTRDEIIGIGQRVGPTSAAALKGPIPDVVARNLPEQIVLQAARADGGRVIMTNLGDTPRLVAVYGEGVWVKMTYSVKGWDGVAYTVHWFKNLTTGLEKEFKFK
jgi:hypothetical protein